MDKIDDVSIEETNPEESVVQESLWKKRLKKIMLFFTGLFVVFVLIISVYLFLGSPNKEAVKKSLAKTTISTLAQQQALQVLDCISSNTIRTRVLVPYIGRISTPPIPGWFVIRMRRRFAVVDYSLSSTKKRMWILDSTTGEILEETQVRHGDGGGSQKKKYVDAFSNTSKSQLSSLGVILGTFPTIGGLQKKWPSKKILLLEGQEKHWNTNIRTRSIVLHSTNFSYSDGCLSMPIEHLTTSISELAFGGIIFSHYPDAKYTKESTYLNCSE